MDAESIMRRPRSLTVIATILIAASIYLMFQINIRLSDPQIRSQAITAIAPVPLSVLVSYNFLVLLLQCIAGAALLFGKGWGRTLYVVMGGAGLIVEFMFYSGAYYPILRVATFVILSIVLFTGSANAYLSRLQPQAPDAALRRTSRRSAIVVSFAGIVALAAVQAIGWKGVIWWADRYDYAGMCTRLASAQATPQCVECLVKDMNYLDSFEPRCISRTSVPEDLILRVWKLCPDAPRLPPSRSFTITKPLNEQQDNSARVVGGTSASIFTTCVPAHMLQ